MHRGKLGSLPSFLVLVGADPVCPLLGCMLWGIVMKRQERLTERARKSEVNERIKEKGERKERGAGREGAI